MKSSEQTTPLWPQTTRIPARPPLAADAAADVVVVGAGMAGLSAAYGLAIAGRRVVVLDAGQVGGGETERTTAHLSTVLDCGYLAVERVRGPASSRLAAESHARAIDEIERIAAFERIDCGFERVDGFLFAPPNSPLDLLEAELGASQRAGLIGVERVSHAPLGDYHTGPAVRYPRQAQFNPLRYVAALAAAVERLGGRIYGDTRAVAVDGGPGAGVTTKGGRRVSAGAVVVATNTPFNDRVVLQTKQASYRSYVVAAPVAAGSVQRGLFWDLEQPFHYARAETLTDGTVVLMVGGEDHKTGQGNDHEKRYRRLEEWARARFPSFGKVSHRWSGQIVNTADGLAYIGRNPGAQEDVYVVTGDCGHGMTHGAIAGILLPALIAGRDHRWSGLYQPNRTPARSFNRWARENLNAAAQYGSLLLPGEVSSPEDVAPGCGAVMRRGLGQVAVYRAPDGTVHENSASCPHLGAAVCWNAAEKTWDCPAHGSRFSAEGKVLNGPANSDLPSAKVDADAG